MPVKKATPSILRKTDIDYDIIPRESVNSITNPDALAVWVYLISRPPNWIVRKTDIMNRFGIGRDRYTKARQELESLGLLVTAHVKDPETGKLQGTVIWVNHTSESTEIPDFRHVGKPTGRETRPLGKTAPLKMDILIKDEDISSKQEDLDFIEFWNRYPRKEAKKKSQIAFNRLTKEDKQKAIKDCLGRFDGVEKRFIMLPTTYIHGERWNDDIDSPDNNYAKGAI